MTYYGNGIHWSDWHYESDARREDAIYGEAVDHYSDAHRSQHGRRGGWYGSRSRKSYGTCPDAWGCSRRGSCPYGCYPPKPGECDYYGDID
jgi:hypothetical protein